MRALWLAGAVLAMTLVWTGPLSAAAGGSFAGHMARHMLLVTLVPIALAAGVSGTRIDPTLAAPRLFSPLVASLAELVVVWLWHLPAWHHAAGLGGGVAVAEQAMFLAAGMWFWAAVVGGGPARRRAMAAESLVALVLTFAHMTMLGVLLGLAPRPLLTHEPGASLSALADQQLGAAIMLATSAVVYVSAGLWLGHRLLRSPVPQEVTS